MVRTNRLEHVKEMVVAVGLLALAGATVHFGVRATKAESALEQSRAQSRIVLQKLRELDDTYGKIRDYTGVANALASPERVIAARHGDTVVRTVSFEPFGGSPFEKARAELLDVHRSEADSFLYSIDRIERTRAHADMLARRLNGLADILKANKSLIAAIPSILPAEGSITSEFGVRLSPFAGKRHMHAGLDVAAEIGTKIVAAADATVSFVGDFEDLGKTVVLDHGNGIITRYGHTNSTQVRQGQKVKRGQQIATVGNTGRSTGPHLHYEIWVGNNPVNPREFLFDLSDGPILAARRSPDRTTYAQAAPLPSQAVERLPMPRTKQVLLQGQGGDDP